MELLRLAKSTSLEKVTLNSIEIKPVAITIIELCLSEGISKLVNQLVNQ